MVCHSIQLSYVAFREKTNPTFNYTIMERKGDTVLLDEVKYLKKGKNKTIVGYDKTLDDSNTRFIWRGKGLLFIAKSKWEIIYISDNHRWAIIHFKKTLLHRKDMMSLAEIRRWIMCWGWM